MRKALLPEEKHLNNIESISESVSDCLQEPTAV